MTEESRTKEQLLSEFEEMRRRLADLEAVREQQKQVDKELGEKEEKYRAIVEAFDGLIYICSQDYRVEFMNKRLIERTGYDATGALCYKVLHDRESVCPWCVNERVFKGEVSSWEVLSPKDNRWYHVVNTPIYHTDGSMSKQAMITDITERKAAEKALRESEERYRALYEDNPSMYFTMDAEGTVLSVNSFGAEQLGYTVEELVGQPVLNVFHPDDREAVRDQFARCLQSPMEVAHWEFRKVRKDGSVLWVKEAARAVHGRDGDPVVLVVCEDITERKQAEEERVRLVTAIEQAAEAIFMADTDWIIHYVNPAFERMGGYGRSEIVGQHVCILESGKHDKPFYDSIRETLNRGEVWSGRLINKKKDGTFYQAEATASPVRDQSGAVINYVAIHRDITHEVMIERQLRQAQKMEAIGTLAGGIAHDFNNILAAITGFTEMALRKVPKQSPAQRDLERVLNAASRATDVVRQILTFSHQTELERKPILVAPLVKEALKLLRSSLPTTIDIRQDIAISREEGVVLGDPTEIHQVLMNLCTNAAHALRGRGGILSVGLAKVQVDSSLVSRHPGMRVGPYVCLSVSDTGHGMDAAVMERIFEPYFTTKAAGEGTGLGLAVVQGIVRSCGGAVTVYSEPGQGTTFRVYLPRIEKEIAPEPRPVEVVPTGGERILFVDDEDALVDLGTQMLRSLGYDVVGRTRSLEALEAFRARPDAFDLVITDMTMPGLTGVELAKELTAIRPDVPIILCTGFSELIDGKQVKEARIREFVLKPYATRHFANTIRKVLEGK
jgi:PAS domain S-box-containing protein